MPVKESAMGAPEGATPPTEDKPQRRRRRSKAEIEADKISNAKIPNDDDEVTVVFSETVGTFAAGSTQALLWPDALRLAREGKVTLSEKHEFARRRLDQETQAKLDAEDAEFEGRGRTPELDEQVRVKIDAGGTIAEFDWTWREVVKHVVFNKNDNLECLDPEVQQALERIRASYEANVPGAGPASLEGRAPSDEELDKLIHAPTDPDSPSGQQLGAPGEGVASRHDELAAAALAASDGPETVSADEDANVEVEREGAPIVEQVGMGVWKVGMGFIEKIGLPDYSSLAIGPCTASTHVLDDGRRTTYEMKDRGTGLPTQVELPTVVVEKLKESSDICEVIMRAQRQSMINFLEAVKPSQPPAAPAPASVPAPAS